MATEALNKITQPTVYFMPSDSHERERLMIQHRLMLKETGRKHIHAPIDPASISSVLETATGSGIWLEEVASQLPVTVELIGVDISPNLFPLSPPTNVQFLQRSVLDLPGKWTNKFDLVHQRLLISGLRSEEWHTALSEIYRVLRPGGWFQLYETYDWAPRGPTMQKMTDLMHRLFEFKGIGTWPCSPEQFKGRVEDAGFRDIRVTWHAWRMGKWAGEDGLLWKKDCCDIMRGTKLPIINAGGFGIVNGEEEFDEWIEDMDRELDTLDGTSMQCIMICGQKPL